MTGRESDLMMMIKVLEGPLASIVESSHSRATAGCGLASLRAKRLLCNSYVYRMSIILLNNGQRVSLRLVFHSLSISSSPHKMMATHFFKDFTTHTLALLAAELIKYSVIKIADLLSHSCSKPFEDGYNSGMFNELCHCKP